MGATLSGKVNVQRLKRVSVRVPDSPIALCGRE
jgi:hypothetical protein